MRRARIHLAGWLWIASASWCLADPATPVPGAPPPRIAAAVFAGPVPYRHLRLSPQGDHLLALQPVGARQKVVVFDFAGGKTIGIPLPDKAQFDEYFWAGERRVLIRVGWTLPFDMDEAYFTRLFVLDLATETLKMVGDRDLGPRGGDVIYVDPSGAWMLVAMQRTIYDYPSVYRVDLATLKRELAEPSVVHVWHWQADHGGTVRLGAGELNTSWFALYRSKPGEKLQRLPGSRFDTVNFESIHINPGSDEGFVLSNEVTGRFGLYHYNFATQALGKLVYQSDTNDIDDYRTEPTGTVVESVNFTDERRRTVWMEPLLRSYQRRLEADNPGKLVEFLSWNRDRTRFVVYIGSDDDPGATYLFAPDGGPLKRLMQWNAALDGAKLAKTRYTRYRARDGLEIPAYLTLPPGREPKGLPLVILPHGGPYSVRDELGFDPEVQFLANRGYVVLQPNYRGSGGYGKQFYERGEGQWGRAMQDDLDDGMDWLVKDGVVDPKRVCVYGGSYGGYAALWAATRNPERYRCAASYAGVSDVARQLKYQVADMWNRYRGDWQAKVKGSPDFDLDTISPLKQVERLQVPVLIGHGDDDQVVPIKQSALYASALKRAGKPHEFHIYEGEGHGLFDAADEQDWLERLDAFLARYNPAR
jgi:dienelactone hydrolase